MKITISEIPEEGLELEFDERISTDTLKTAGPVHALLRIEKRESEVFVSGLLTSVVELQCSRCLKPFTLNVKSNVNVVYHPASDLSRDEHHELKGDELDMAFYKGDELDTSELIVEQLMLCVPIKPLCTSDCKGICPQCGVDLNETQCGCEFRETDPRLKALEQLLKRKE